MNEQAEKTIRVLVAPLLFPFAPRRVARWHEHTPLWQLYIAHWIGMILATATFRATYLIFDYFGVEGPGFPLPFRTNMTLITYACGEVAFIAVAMSMTCWAARPEPIKNTFHHTLRMSWLFSGHLTWIAISFVAAMHLMPPKIIIGPSPPRYYMYTISFALIAATIIWSIVSYLRAVTAPRNNQPLQQSHPLCEWCGYTLSHLDGIDRCPECGKPTAPSIEENPRIPYQYRVGAGGLWQFWKTPDQLLRRSTDRRYLGVHQLLHPRGYRRIRRRHNRHRNDTGIRHFIRYHRRHLHHIRMLHRVVLLHAWLYRRIWYRFPHVQTRRQESTRSNLSSRRTQRWRLSDIDRASHDIVCTHRGGIPVSCGNPAGTRTRHRHRTVLCVIDLAPNAICNLQQQVTHPGTINHGKESLRKQHIPPLRLGETRKLLWHEIVLRRIPRITIVI